MALALRRPRTHFFPRPALAPANFRTGTLNDCLVVVAPGGPSSWLNESHPMTVLAFAEGAFAVLSVDLQMDLGSSLDVIARETWQDVQAQLATVGPRKVVFLGYCRSIDPFFLPCLFFHFQLFTEDGELTFWSPCFSCCVWQWWLDVSQVVFVVDC